MRRIYGLCGFVLLPLVAACPVEDQVCFADDDCPSGQSCLESAGLPNRCGDRGADGGGADGGADANAVDAQTPDAGVSDSSVADGGATDGSVADGGATDGGCPPRPVDVFGMALPAGQYDIGDRLLLHLDEVAEPYPDSAGANLFAGCSGATCPSRETCGVYGGALTFDGIDDGLTIDSSIPDFQIGGQAYGFETWFRASATNTSTQCLFEYVDTQAGVVRVTLQPDNSIALHTGAGSSSRNVRDGSWWHLGVTRGLGGVIVTLNLEDVLTGAADPSFVAQADVIRIGHCNDGRYFEGSLDEVRMTRSELHPESDFSVSRREVRVAWEQGSDIHVGNERLTDSRLFAADGIRPAFSRDGSRLAYLRCGVSGDTCDLYVKDWTPGAQERALTSTGDLGRARIAWLENDRIYYTRGAACTRTITHYDFQTTNHTPVVGPDVFGDLDIGAVRELLTDTGLFVVREPCGTGRGGLTRIDDPNMVSGTPPLNDIYSLSSTVGEIVDVRAVLPGDPYEAGYVYLTIQEASGDPRMEVSFWNGPLDTVVAAQATTGGTDLAPSHYTPSYFYYSAAPGIPFDHTDQTMLELFLISRDNGDAQRLTDDALPSRRPTIWFARP